MNNEVLSIWKEASRVIDNRFHYQVNIVPRKIKIISDSETLRFGGYLDETSPTLYITENTNINLIPLAGVIYRECLFHSLPSNICDKAKYDVSCEFARQSLLRGEKQKWEEVWKIEEKIRVWQNLTYTSYATMNWMVSLGGDGELDTLLHEFSSMEKYGRKLDFISYVEYMQKRTQNIDVELNPTEMKVIDALLKTNTTTLSEIADELNLSNAWISTLVNRLQKRYILIKTTNTPFSKIGIRSIDVLVESEPDDDPSRYFAHCPFLFRIQNILNGPGQVLTRLSVPDNHDSVHSIEKMANILRSNGIKVDIAETHSAALHHSFYHYNLTNRRWEIPWLALQGWGNRIENESLDDLVERIDTPAKMTESYIDELDIKILELINKRIISSRELRMKLKIGQKRFSEHFKKLYSEGLIKKNWGAYNLGLVERVALRSHDKRMNKILDVWSRELPKTFLRYDDSRNLLMITELPVGGSTKMMRVIRELGWNVNMALLDIGVYGNWSFPAELWNVKKQRWDAPLEKIQSWLDELVHEIKKL